MEAKTASKNLPQKSGWYLNLLSTSFRRSSQSSSVNELQEVILIFCQRVQKEAMRKPKLSNLKNHPPPNGLPAGILGPDLVVELSRRCSTEFLSRIKDSIAVITKVTQCNYKDLINDSNCRIQSILQVRFLLSNATFSVRLLSQIELNHSAFVDDCT